MSCKLSLPFWPAASNCLSWSKDNWLAIGGGENVAILSPNLHGPDRTGSYWSTATIKVNAFTEAEVPLLDPLSAVNFSIGEEQSQRLIEALSWSPPGIAKFGRCVLAILSSNHTLSIYACYGKPDDVASWERKLIINHAVESHYSTADTLQHDDQEDYDESRQVRQRIRAYAWSPRLYVGDESQEGSLAPYLANGRHILSVSTDTGDILFCLVKSPYSDPLSGASEWSATVVASINIEKHLASLCPQLRIDREKENKMYRINKSIAADSLAWSDNITRDSQGVTTPFAFVAMGRLFTAITSFNSSGSSLHISPTHTRHLLPEITNFGTTLSFVPKRAELVAFTADSVIVFGGVKQPSQTTVSNNPDALLKHGLDDRWDPITGIAFTSRSDKQAQLHFTSHISTTSAEICTLPVDATEGDRHIKPPWLHAIEEAKAIFSTDYDLSGHVQERTLGIAASPLGDYIATCITMHPSDAAAYEPANYQACIINITLEADLPAGVPLPESGGTSFPYDIPADTILFSLQRHVERMGDSKRGLADNNSFSEILEAGMKRTMSDACRDWGEESASSPPGAADPLRNDIPSAMVLKRYICLSPKAMGSRIRGLVNVTLNDYETAVIVEGGYDIVARLVAATLASPPGEEQSANSITKRMFSIALLLHAKMNNGNADTIDHANETCDVCDSPIPLENLHWAKCTNGHCFGRCGLTFVAIQEPGISRYCCICNTQYLDGKELPRSKLSPDEYGGLSHHQANGSSVPDGNQAGGELASQDHLCVRARHADVVKQNAESKFSFPELLFAAIDDCVYCGGKLVI